MTRAIISFLLLLFLSTSLRADDKSAGDVPKGEVTKYSFDKSKVFPGTVREF